MKLLLSFLLAITLWSVGMSAVDKVPDSARQLFEEFKHKYNKFYANEDEEYRFSVFKDNLNRAKRLQAMDMGTAEYGVTQFSDLTSEEFRTRYLGFKPAVPVKFDEHSETQDTILDKDNFDWRDRGAVGPVLEQGHCGSCWAFSTVGNIEGQWFRKTGKFVQLSEQQLVDCDTKDQGCHGGYPPQTYQVVKQMGGLEASSDYPYHARDERCSMDRSKFKAYVNDSIVLSRNENEQAAKLKELGPLSTALNGNMLQFYKHGIMKPNRWLCNPRGLDHAVLTVGYGMEGEQAYWIVKNSWGKNFGEEGYFRIARGSGACGINLVVSTAIVN